ncbi:hypothetical protein IWZ00DRAFT_508901 [Phyllosticta capitalensis]
MCRRVARSVRWQRVGVWWLSFAIFRIGYLQFKVLLIGTTCLALGHVAWLSRFTVGFRSFDLTCLPKPSGCAEESVAWPDGWVGVDVAVASV